VNWPPKQWPPVYWPHPPVVVVPAPGCYLPPPEWVEPAPEVVMRLTCTPITQNLQDLSGLDVAVTPVADGVVHLAGVVGLTDSQQPQFTLDSDADGEFRNTGINLDLPEVGMMHLVPQADANGATYFTGDIQLYGRSDSGNLWCVVSQQE
jgi:hypothetical protein